VIVPFGFVANAPGTGTGRGGAPAGGPNNAPFPSGFDAKPEPYGVSFSGMACGEPKLIEPAYSFEQATKKRIPPPLFP
jgi:amidase